MREEVDPDADEGGGGPAAAGDIFFQEELGGDGVGDDGERGRGGPDERQSEVIEGEEQREESESQEEDSREEEWTGEDSADRSGQAGVGADLVEVAN